jgi:hypothetical protein
MQLFKQTKFCLCDYWDKNLLYFPSNYEYSLKESIPLKWLGLVQASIDIKNDMQNEKNILCNKNTLENPTLIKKINKNTT